MVHKIHMGASLPSVEAGTPYVIIGNSGSVNDFSTVVFPQDIRNCTTCHGSIDPSQPNYATQASNWFTYPSRAACQSCHDDVNFATGANHPAGAACRRQRLRHLPRADGGGEWDAAVIGAHTVPEKSKQLKGVKAEIASVTNTAPGQNPTVLFTLTQNDGTPIPPSAFTTTNSDGSTSSGLNVVMSGPTLDYSIPPQIRERADGATASGASYSYTFTNAIPADATGTWGFSIEARLTVTLNPAPKDTDDREGLGIQSGLLRRRDGFGRRASPRGRGHRQLQHVPRPALVSWRQPPQPAGVRLLPQPERERRRGSPPESIDFKRMIHRIHTGTDLTHDYSISGNSFNDVRFPGDRRDCEKCHVRAAPSRFPTTRRPASSRPRRPKDWYTPMQHNAAACLGCHDTQAAAAHAFTMTAPFGEACAACHGANAEFAVDKVHAQ